MLALRTSRRPRGRPVVLEEQSAAYAAMRAYAAGTLRRGESEGLYRTVDDLMLRGLLGRQPAWLLDVGCGTGRTCVDAAAAFPNAVVVGVDGDPHALLIAHAIAHFRGPAMTADLRAWGFGMRSVIARNLANCLFVQARSEKLPFATDKSWVGFDGVACVNELDRSHDPRETVREIARVLAPQGRLVLATPLNWRSPGGARWEELATLEALEALLTRTGLEVDEAFDGLVYREVIDVRGSSTDWHVAVISAYRRSDC